MQNKEPWSQVIGHSVLGRPIQVTVFGSGERRLLAVGGVHGNELGASVAAHLLAYLAKHPSKVASGTEIDIVPCLNPDGRATGARTNAHHVDLNRNFPASNWSVSGARRGESAGSAPASEPETRALASLLETRRYDVVISLHSRGGLVDFDGPGGGKLAARIGKISHTRVVHLATLYKYHGSLGRYVPERYSIPVITWELSSSRMTPGVLAGLLTATD